MLINASASNPKNGPEELQAVRMTITNAIVDPWIYIILRKQNLVKISRLIRRIPHRKHFPAIFITEESNYARAGTNEAASNTSRSANTISTQI
jgi:hypothetical protein